MIPNLINSIFSTDKSLFSNCEKNADLKIGGDIKKKLYKLVENIKEVESRECLEKWIDTCPFWSVHTYECTEKYLSSLVSNNEEDKNMIKEKFQKRLQFGTAGIRGVMNIGFNSINEITVLQTIQGLGRYLKKTYKDIDIKTRGVTIGYDGRKNSKEYAYIATIVLLSMNIKVFLFDDFVATPILAFAGLFQKSLCSVMITASHNPKHDNGIKVYGDNGAQIIQPIDKYISDCILEDLSLTTEYLDWYRFETNQVNEEKLHACISSPISSNTNTSTYIPYNTNSSTTPNINTPTNANTSSTSSNFSFSSSANSNTNASIKELNASLSNYFEYLDNTLIRKYFDNVTSELSTNVGLVNSCQNLIFTYTAMHGVGYPFVQMMLSRFGLRPNCFVPVKEQMLPNPEFTTLPFPNPEEKNVFDLAMKTAEANNSNYIIATDPDGDRFAAAERQPDGSWLRFTGDQIGILFASHLLKERNRCGVSKNEMLFVCSAASSKRLEKFSKMEGCRFEETLTGFKWMMNKAIELHEKEKLVLILAYEEALGYSLSSQVLDKDGISASGVWVEMVCNLNQKGLTLKNQLDLLDEKLGKYVNNNGYGMNKNSDQINEVFENFRNSGKYFWSIGDYKIKDIRDVTKGYDSRQEDKKCKLPLVPSSQTLTLYFENSAVFTLRGSGTEPKLKWYGEMNGESEEEMKETLKHMVESIKQNFCQPHKYSFTF